MRQRAPDVSVSRTEVRWRHRNPHPVISCRRQENTSNTYEKRCLFLWKHLSLFPPSLLGVYPLLSAWLKRFSSPSSLATFSQCKFSALPFCCLYTCLLCVQASPLVFANRSAALFRKTCHKASFSGIDSNAEWWEILSVVRKILIMSMQTVYNSLFQLCYHLHRAAVCSLFFTFNHFNWKLKLEFFIRTSL